MLVVYLILPGQYSNMVEKSKIEVIPAQMLEQVGHLAEIVY